jgi:hypothetical protein
MEMAGSTSGGEGIYSFPNQNLYHFLLYTDFNPKKFFSLWKQLGEVINL